MEANAIFLQAVIITCMRWGSGVSIIRKEVNLYTIRKATDLEFELARDLTARLRRRSSRCLSAVTVQNVHRQSVDHSRAFRNIINKSKEIMRTCCRVVQVSLKEPFCEELRSPKSITKTL